METFDEAALTLGGAPQALGAHDGGQDARFARRGRWRQVLVEKRGLDARASSIRQRRDPDDSLAARQRDAHEVSRAEGARRLHGLVVHVHLAPVARCRGKGPALEKAGGPEPLVHSELRHDALTLARTVGYTPRGESSATREAAAVDRSPERDKEPTRGGTTAREAARGGRGDTMRRGTVLAVLLLAAASVAWAQGAQLVVEDWSKTPVGQKGVPIGWKVQNWGSPNYDFEIESTSSTRILHMKSNGDSSTINKEVKIDCKDYQILQWSWKVVELPKGADARKKATDDEAAQIYVTFPRFPSAVRSRIIGYIWDSTAPAGSVFKSQKTGLVTYVVVRSGEADLNKWLTESRNVCQDYKKIYGEDPDEKIEAISVGIDSDDTRSRAEAYVGEILFRKS